MPVVLGPGPDHGTQRAISRRTTPRPRHDRNIRPRPAKLRQLTRDRTPRQRTTMSSTRTPRMARQRATGARRMARQGASGGSMRTRRRSRVEDRTQRRLRSHPARRARNHGVRRRHPSSRPDCQNCQREREADAPARPLRSPSRFRGRRHRGSPEPHPRLGQTHTVIVETRIVIKRHTDHYR
jgi:hypothetical protein